MHKEKQKKVCIKGSTLQVPAGQPGYDRLF